jgi:IclR family transcriptional regulator, acetate operon repressor
MLRPLPGGPGIAGVIAVDLSNSSDDSGCVARPDVAVGATYQSAERVLALLTSFDDSRAELGVTEMAGLIGVHKSTASRLAAALERAGLLTRTGRRFRLGVEAIRLGALALRGFDLVASMQPAMDGLSRQTGETVNLAVPDGSEVLNVAEVPSTYILSCSGRWIGRRTAPHAVANGKVLMAYGAMAVPGQLERYTAQTITGADALEAELAAVRRDGYAAAVAELEEELVAVASPVFDGTGACVAALSVSGPAHRMKPEALGDLGRRCAAASAGAVGPGGAVRPGGAVGPAGATPAGAARPASAVGPAVPAQPARTPPDGPR